jgi:hypothetical protein
MGLTVDQREASNTDDSQESLVDNINAQNSRLLMSRVTAKNRESVKEKRSSTTRNSNLKVEK